MPLGKRLEQRQPVRVAAVIFWPATLARGLPEPQLPIYTKRRIKQLSSPFHHKDEEKSLHLPGSPITHLGPT